METKSQKTICKVIHYLADLMLLCFVFFFAFLSVCGFLSTILDFSIGNLLVTVVCAILCLINLKIIDSRNV